MSPLKRPTTRQMIDQLSRYLPAPVTEYSAFAYSLGRGAGFLAEMRAVQLAAHLSRKNRGKGRVPGPTRETVELTRAALFRALREDAHNIAQGVYPPSVLEPEELGKHARRLPRLLWDAVKIQRRRDQGRTTEFTEEAKERAEESPRYFRRNFHFQTDGYLSEESAELYDHQVELLFTGSADAMRRLLLEDLREHFGPGAGKGLKILEVAAGTGSASRFIKLAFPKAHLTVTDLSDPYLKVARQRMAQFERVDFCQADATSLPFKDGEFDAVVSVFLFHELPFEERKKALAEMARVVRPAGLVAAVDSLQLNDVPEFNPLLEQFPKDFHEPFYRNYSENPLERQFEEAGLGTALQTRRRFLSKSVRGTRPA